MAGVVAHLPGEGPKFVPVSTEILARCASEVVAYVRKALCSAIGTDEEEGDFRVLYAEKDLLEGDEKQEEAFKEKLESGKPCMVRVLFSLLGGKGGFGALLRKQANKGKKTKNFDSMRDLTGRRLRHSTAVDKIKEWMQKQKAEDDLVNLIAGEGPELPKVAAPEESLDPEFVRKLKRSAVDRPAVVSAGLAALAAEGASSSKRVKSDASAGAKSSASSTFASALDSLGDLSGSGSEASPDGEPSPDGEEAGAGSSSSAAAAAPAASKPQKEEPKIEEAAAAAVQRESASAALAEAIAESFCVASEKEGQEDEAKPKTSSTSAPLPDCELIGADGLKKFKDAAELEKKVSPEVLKQSLMKLGLKCGGTPKDRAARLFLLKFSNLEDLPKKEFAK